MNMGSLNRICDAVNEVVPPEQAGFRIGRCCTDQVMSLTNYIESGYQHRLKTGVVFVDLTAAYDTVWKKGLLFKLLKVIPSLTICNVISNMLSDRIFQVLLNNKTSSFMKLNNGLPQGSVLAPLLFNLYIHDLPTSAARKFIYADDIAYATQAKQFKEIEETLTTDMDLLTEYCGLWRLNPSQSKTESSCFHLDNRQSHYSLKVLMSGALIKYNPNPKYLGITLDRTLTFKQHLQKLRGKLGTRNNIISKLSSTTCLEREME